MPTSLQVHPGIEWLCARRSVRRFRAEPVSEGLVRQVLEAARWAPSPHNSQPWRFVAIVSEAARRRLAGDMAVRWRADLAADGLAAEDVARRVGPRHRRLLEAPAAVVACLVLDGLDAYLDARRQQAELATAVQSLGAAVQNLLLAAHGLGLGAGWVCAPLFCPDTVQAALDLEPSWEPQALVLLGYAAGEPRPRTRRPIEELVIFR